MLSAYCKPGRCGDVEFDVLEGQGDVGGRMNLETAAAN
jgi:hypothetical protein